MSFFSEGLSRVLFSWRNGLECLFVFLEGWSRVFFIGGVVSSVFFSGRGSLECLFSWRDGLERVEDDAETLAGTQCK